MATDVYTSSSSWVAPAGVTSVDVECYGGGGGGSASTTRLGGGGGAYAKQTGISVTPGNSYTVTVGAGGAATVNGGDSWFSTPSTVKAAGGVAGPTGTGGTTANSIGGTLFRGGNGQGGGGGGAAGGGARPARALAGLVGAEL